MKRVVFLVVLLILAVFLSSCHNSQFQTDVYDVLINEEIRSLSNIDASKYGFFSVNGTQYVNDVETEREIKFLDESYTVTYLYSISSKFSGENLDYYYNDKLDCQIAFSANTDNILRIVSNTASGVIVPADVSVSNTESYFYWLNNVIKSVFGVDVNNYTLCCKTHYTDLTSEESFVTSSINQEKQVGYYYIEYAEYFGNYKSSEIVKMTVQPDGSLISLVHLELSNINVDNLSISEDKLDQTIKNTVHDIFASKYTVMSYTVNSMLWRIYDGNPCLICGVEIRCTDSAGDEFGNLVLLAIFP